MDLRNLDSLVKDITLVAKKGKTGINHFVKVDLVNGSSTELFCDKEFVQAVKVFKDIYDQPIKTKKLVEEYSEEKDKIYTCILIVLADGSEFRYFPKRAFNIIVNALYSKMQNKKEK